MKYLDKRMKQKQEETRVCAACGNMLYYTKKDFVTCPFCRTKNKVTRIGKYGIEFEIANQRTEREKTNEKN